jgi:hypothetical protein
VMIRRMRLTDACIESFPRCATAKSGVNRLQIK